MLCMQLNTHQRGAHPLWAFGAALLNASSEPTLIRHSSTPVLEFRLYLPGATHHKLLMSPRT
jgi:hypothetical protein